MLYAVIEVQGQPRVTPQGPARPDRVQIQAPSGTPMQRNLSRFGFSHSLYRCYANCFQCVSLKVIVWAIFFSKAGSDVNKCSARAPYSYPWLFCSGGVQIAWFSSTNFLSGLSWEGFGERPHKRSAGKSTSVQFFLLSRSSERTPKPSEELALLHAGLGRRTVNVPEGASHNEVGVWLDLRCL